MEAGDVDTVIKEPAASPTRGCWSTRSPGPTSTGAGAQPIKAAKVAPATAARSCRAARRRWRSARPAAAVRDRSQHTAACYLYAEQPQVAAERLSELLPLDLFRDHRCPQCSRSPNSSAPSPRRSGSSPSRPASTSPSAACPSTALQAGERAWDLAPLHAHEAALRGRRLQARRHRGAPAAQQGQARPRRAATRRSTPSARCSRTWASSASRSGATSG